MSVHDLPGPHVRLVFAVMLYRDGLLTDRGLRTEAVAAFGPEAGALIVAQLLLSSRAVEVG